MHQRGGGSQEPSRSPVAIVGAGLAGLFVAHELAARWNVRSVVIEQGAAVRELHEGEDRRELPGDARRQPWEVLDQSGDWGTASGVKPRVGGRSLCWHGVVLPIERVALDTWPRHWSDRLIGPGGYYERVLDELGDWRALSTPPK